ncbi:MAG: hypothetical protein JSV95_04585 [Gemmatimonadota bacterium]|jgi:hypothetical protein|nr:MAG: hypothetical protein JSV95_04585 [Gemmatimonadota bacterium]
MRGVDGLQGRELDAAVQREAMDSVVGWILLPDGTRNPVFVRAAAGRADRLGEVQPRWVACYSTDPAAASAIDRRMEILGLTDLYERTLRGTARGPDDKCRAGLIAVRAARLTRRLKVSAA